MKQGLVRLLYNFGKRFMGWTLHMIMCVLRSYPVSIRIYYQQGVLFLVYINFQLKFPYFSSYDNFYCIEICLPTAYFTSSLCVLKRGFPKFGLFFSKRPAGFHCRKRPSPTFTNIWSHCPWALQSAATVISSSAELVEIVLCCRRSH